MLQSMSDVLQIKQFELSEQESLLNFLRIVYPKEPRKHSKVFWEWHYLKNPHTSPGNIPLWIVKKGRDIVGQIATIPVEVKVADDTRRAIWILDFIVREDFRGQGLGKRLVATASESFPTMMALGINEQSTAVFRKLGWAHLGGIHRYHRLLYAGDAVDEISQLAPLRLLGNLAYAASRARLRRMSKVRTSAVRLISSFDTSFNDLWRRAAKQWPCAVVRNGRYLDWQFLQQPGKKFEVLGLFGGQELLGYVVLFFRKPSLRGRPPKAAISDICYDPGMPDEIIDQLLKAAIDLALERHAGSLVTDVLDGRVEDKLMRYGFRRIRKAPQFMAFSPESGSPMYTRSNWFLTRGDSDVTIFEDPNLE
jgi:GNAT superfamily N-acetyltransferase